MEKEFLHIPQERDEERQVESFCLSEAAHCFIGFAGVSVSPLELVITKPRGCGKNGFTWWLHCGNNGFTTIGCAEEKGLVCRCQIEEQVAPAL